MRSLSSVLLHFLMLILIKIYVLFMTEEYYNKPVKVMLKQLKNYEVINERKTTHICSAQP